MSRQTQPFSVVSTGKCGNLAEALPLPSETELIAAHEPWSFLGMSTAELATVIPQPPVEARMASAQAHLVQALQALELSIDDSEGAAEQRTEATAYVRRALAVINGSASSTRELAASMSPAELERFGGILRDRRKVIGLSQAQLAERTGISPRTIRNIELGAHTPSRDTLCRLLSVSELGLRVSEVSADATTDPTWAPSGWFHPKYDPVSMTLDLAALLNSPAGQLEQTFLYLDGQSSADWLSLCSSQRYAEAFRDVCPLDRVAAQIAKLSRGTPVDVYALGSGDGRAEVMLVKHLLDLRPQPPDVSLLLLDISHSLLTIAHQHAREVLASLEISINFLHANFNEIARIPLLHATPARRHRRRVYALLGCTVANLTNELHFFDDLALCAAPGDLAVVDYQLCYAPASRPDEIRRKDPPLANGVPQSHWDWLSGPIRRYCRGYQTIRLETRLEQQTKVPGSYEVDAYAHVKMRDGGERRFLVWRGRRYDEESFIACVGERGWRCVLSMSYGPGAAKGSAVMLLERI